MSKKLKVLFITILCLISCLFIQSIFVGAASNSSSKEISVTVPSKITITVDSKGRTVVRDREFDIDNDSDYGVIVTKVQVNAKDDWEIVPYSDSMSKYDNNEHVISFSFNGYGTRSNGTIKVDKDDWFIRSGRSMSIDMNVKFPTQDYMEKTEIASIDWSFELVSGSEKVTVKQGVNGGTDGSNVYTDVDGRIRTFPEPRPNAGYIFDHWEGPNGDYITSDYVFTDTPEITPVFIKGYTIYVEDGVGGKITSSYKKYYTDQNYVVQKLPTCEPDANYKFIAWVDANGREIKVGTTLSSDIYIHPLFETTVKIGFDISFNEIENCRLSSTQTIRTGKEGIVPSLPTVTCADGWVFKSWLSSDGTTIIPGMTITKDITLTPVIVFVTNFIIEFEDSEYGRISSLTPITTGDDGTVPSLPTVEAYRGWIFNGWFNGSGEQVLAGQKITGNVKLVAKFTKDPNIKFTIDFDTRNAPCTITLSTGRVETDSQGKILELPTAVVQQGYTFIGFVYDDNKVLRVGDYIVGDLTAGVAVRTPSSQDISISFEAGPNGTISANSVIQVPWGTSMEDIMKDTGKLPTTQSDYGVFKGWAVGSKDIDETHLFLRDETVTAMFNSYFVLDANSLVTGFSDTYNTLINKPKSIRIPNTIDGRAVLGIGKQAFKGTFVDSFDIANGIRSIGEEAFCDSKATTYTMNGDSIEEIGKRAFYNTKSNNINISSSCTNIGEEAFAKSTITSASVPEKIKVLGEGAFKETNITSINLPNTLPVIPKYLCQNCPNLSSATIPENVTEISAYAFAGCEKITTFNLPRTIQKVDVTNFNRSYDSLTIPEGAVITCPKDYSVPYTRVRNKISFTYSEESITSLMLSGDIKYWSEVEVTGNGDLPANAFAGCDSLTKITVPDTSKNRSNAPFGATSARDNVTYTPVN